MVVTLEPCAHQGKQPPCTEAIIHSGIRRVVAALRDPNPIASRGAERLQQAGIEVELGPLAETAAAQNAIFLHSIRHPARPYVALKLATTLDGRIADSYGRARWISGPEAREYVQWLRAGFDAIVVGGRTARLDDPSLTVRGPVKPRVPRAGWSSIGLPTWVRNSVWSGAPRKSRRWWWSLLRPTPLASSGCKAAG